LENEKIYQSLEVEIEGIRKVKGEERQKREERIKAGKTYYLTPFFLLSQIRRPK
jgi:hypothetical protein